MLQQPIFQAIGQRHPASLDDVVGAAYRAPDIIAVGGVDQYTNQ